jgi:hypothetical protein
MATKIPLTEVETLAKKWPEIQTGWESGKEFFWGLDLATGPDKTVVAQYHRGENGELVFDGIVDLDTQNQGL